MKSILYLTQYYSSEKGAAALRATEHSKLLSKLGHEVTVIAPFENYPSGKIDRKNWFKLYTKTTHQNLTVYRIPILALGRSKSIHHYLLYFSFVFTSFIFALFLRKRSVLICSSPPLFLGISGLLISFLKGTKLILEVRDLWPESVKLVKKLNDDNIFIKLAESLERLLYKSASEIIILTKGFSKHIQNRTIIDKCIFAPNGINNDISNLNKDLDLAKEIGIDSNLTTIGYYGVLGEAQSLDFIIDVAKSMKDKVQFLIVGFGAHFELLQARIKKEGVSNVCLLPAVPQNEIQKFVNLCDIYLISLTKSDLFKITIPSKIFAGMNSKKAILAGIEGEAAEIINSSKSGICFEPQSVEGCIKAIENYVEDKDLIQKSGALGYEYAQKNYLRTDIIKNVSNSINRL